MYSLLIDCVIPRMGNPLIENINKKINREDF